MPPFDPVIVGGGAAGCVRANRLGADGRQGVPMPMMVAQKGADPILAHRP